MSPIETTNFDEIAERYRNGDNLKGLKRKRLFVLLLGPSGVGKSTIIREINNQTGNRYPYISPFTTRALRSGETEKTSVSEGEFDSLAQKGAFVLINELYGVRYGTPLQSIINAFSLTQNPILDFPLEKVQLLHRKEFDLLNIYVFPPSITEWRSRLDKEGRNTSNRFESGIVELTMLAELTKPHQDIHYSVVSRSGDIPEIARSIDLLISSIPE